MPGRGGSELLGGRALPDSGRDSLVPEAAGYGSKMAFDSKPGKMPVPPSKHCTSASRDAQLFSSARVGSDVGSIAIDRGALAMVGGPPQPQVAADVGGSGELTDAQVMLKVKTGDDSAFDYLVQKYRRPMMSFMYRMAHNAAVAEDLAQEVFLRVYRSREKYEASAKFTTWLYRIATNLAVNHARDTRQERPENTVIIDEPDEESGRSFDVPDAVPTAEENLVRRERLAAIRQRVEALPERQRLAVVMHKYQQMDYRQIADVLKLSESATKSLLFRAYETLREQLKEFI
jgi:RNA polymerase sigma-70 factor, ECF subfamily